MRSDMDKGACQMYSIDRMTDQPHLVGWIGPFIIIHHSGNGPAHPLLPSL